MAALDALARRHHASEDLRRRLVDKGFDAAVVAGVIERLIQEHLLDDRRYVDNFVASHAARGQGPLRVRADLRKFGVQGPLVEESLAAYESTRQQAAGVLADAKMDVDLTETIQELEGDMLKAAEDLQFEKAALLRDQIKELKHMLDGGPPGAGKSGSYKKPRRRARKFQVAS